MPPAPGTDAREQALVTGILSTGAPQAVAVVALLRHHLRGSADAAERAAVLARFERALAGTPDATDAFAALARNTLVTVLERNRAALLAGALPSGALLMAGARLLQERSWSGVVAVLAMAGAYLPSLRSQAQFEALVQSLPQALRDSLLALHGWVEQLDAPFAPRLSVPPLMAVAAAALLWQMQRALPPAAAHGKGVYAFIAALPRHWQTLAVLNRVGGALLAAPGPDVDGWLRLTHVRGAGAGIAAAPPLPLDAAAAPVHVQRGGPVWEREEVAPHHRAEPSADDSPPAVTSAASRTQENALIAFGSSMVVSGLAMIHQGCRMLGWARGTPPVWPDVALPDAGGLVAMLDGIVDVEGGTVWQRIQACVRNAAADDPDALAAEVEERLMVNDLVEQVLVHSRGGLASVPGPAPHGRVRRAVNDHDYRPASPTVAPRQDSAQQRELRSVSRVLAKLAKEAPKEPAEPDGVARSPQDKVELATARMYLETWMRPRSNDTAQQERETAQRLAALNRAVADLVYSDRRLEQVGGWLPQMDAHIATQLTQRIRAVTNNTVVPSAIYRNIFADYAPWKDWEAKQSALDPTQFPLYRPYPEGYVRETVVSSHSLVQVAGMGGGRGEETDDKRAALYNDGLARTTYFPAEECTEVTLDQFNAAIKGHDFIAAFMDSLDAFIASCRKHDGGQASNGAHPERDAYVDALKHRLSATLTLVRAMGPLNGSGDWLMRTLLRHPSRFGLEEPLGRDLALPGQTIRVNQLQAQPPGGDAVKLWGVLLAESDPSPERAHGAVLVIAPSRLPLVEQFVSREAALHSLRDELEQQQMHTWIAESDHARWRAGGGPVGLGPGVEDDLLQHLFLDLLSLRSAQLHHSVNATGLEAGEARKRYLDLDRRLLALPPPAPMPMLTAAHERLSERVQPYDVPGAHWLGQVTPAVLRNAEDQDAEWLAWLASTRSLVMGMYPVVFPYVTNRLAQKLLEDHGAVVDPAQWWLLRFSGGTASRESPSGFVHSAAQKVGACTLVECAFNKARDYPDGDPGSPSLGIYSADDTATFDQDTELGELLPGQYITSVRSLDLRADYFAAVDTFWKRHRNDVVLTLRGVYMFAAWQQFAEGSLSVRGLQLALAATGFMSRAQAENPDAHCHMTDGVRASWVGVYDKVSSLLRIEHARWKPVLLYAPGDNVAFREFSDAAQADSWLTRVVHSEQGRDWLEGSFSLADLEDGWFSNGLDTSLDKAHGDIFPPNRTALLIDGRDVFDAMATKLEERTNSDGRTLLASNGETLAHNVLQRMTLPAAALNLASVVFPELLPVVILVDAAQILLGSYEAVHGPTGVDRKEGLTSAALGTAGLVVDGAAFGLARTSRLMDVEGRRVLPAVQALDETAEDPLKSLSARFAQPASVVVDGARPADNGVYHFAGKHYIRQSGHTYEVVFDPGNRTWRLKNPNPGSLYQNPVRLNADGLWEPHADVGLRGGAPDTLDTVSQRSWDMNYKRALTEEVRRSSQSLDSAGSDFHWGKTHWERVVLPKLVRDDASLQEMQELFVSGPLDARQRGALSTIISKIQQSRRIALTVQMEEQVCGAARATGGHMYPFSQWYLEPRGGGRMGFCTAFSRLGAVAIERDAVAPFVKNVVDAIRRPTEGRGAQLMSLVRDAQGVQLLPGATSVPVRMAYDEIAPFLKNIPGDGQFFLTSSLHHMLVGRKGRMYYLLDPTFGLSVHYDAGNYGRWLGQLFSSRYFSTLLRLSRGGRGETLAELYGAAQASERDPATLFMIRQVDLKKLAWQADVRGWSEMLRDVPD